ncbi:acyl-CoA thioesterase [Thiotrichales bacterium 19S3-7]|nr:acyl-CoA thioesterase [Thiotrichales bacterium 19S3-7]MCF6802187.1 acyl-CoA thioesterase [Thiotrichales bacterium 19S3-11]
MNLGNHSKVNLALSERTELEIAFFDVDSMRIVWHGNYIKYLEIARCRLLDKLGYNYLDMEEEGLIWPVIDMRIKYIKPIHFKQVILIDASVVEYENRLKIQYVIYDKETLDKLTKAYSIQVAVNHKTSQMYYQSPKHIIDKFNQLKESV